MTVDQQAILKAAQAKIAALGFKKEKNLGMNILAHNEGETVLVKITSGVQEFTTKDGDTHKFITVDNLETGETEMTYWVSGGVKYQLETLKDGFIGGEFAITHLGKHEAEIKDENGKYQKTMVNQFNIVSLSKN